MGQYFMAMVVNENFEQQPENAVVAAIEPHDYDNFCKLTEHSYIGNNYVNAALNMLYEHNGQRFVWCGDYYQNDAIAQLKDEDGDAQTLYKLGQEFIEKELTKTSHVYYNTEGNFLYAINLDKNEYVTFPKDKMTKLVFHPLPLLCANSNGLGGGDYEGNNEEVGRWAFDHIVVTNEKPSKEFKSINKLTKF